MLDWLTNTADFLPRDCCGTWEPWLKWIYIVSNAAIAVSYLIITIALLTLWWKRRALLPSPWMVVLFAAFIFLCGKTHWADAVAFWWPNYRAFTVLSALTALASVGTAATLPSVVRRLLTYKSPEEYQQIQKRMELEATARMAAEKVLTGRNDKLRIECDELRSHLTDLSWQSDIQAEVLKMREILHRIRGA